MIISCIRTGEKTESDAIITFSVVIWKCCYQQHDNDWCIGWCCWCWHIFITTVTIDPEDTTCCSHCRLNRPTRSKQPMRIAVHIAPIENAGRSGARDLYIYALYYVATPFDDAPLAPLTFRPIYRYALQRIIHNVIMDTCASYKACTLCLERGCRTRLFTDVERFRTKKKNPLKIRCEDAKLESRADVLMIITVATKRVYYKNIFCYSIRSIIAW